MCKGNKIIITAFLLYLFSFGALSQSGVGVGIYPTGTETGLGVRSGKNSRVALEGRITRANLYKSPKPSSFVSELSGIYRLVYLEKVRFHVGLGFRADFNFREHHKYGAVIPIGVEAFPFPFQNAGLFFEAAPFGTRDYAGSWNSGVRTVAGFVFYFPNKNENNKL